MLCKWQFISKTARHSFHTTNAISFARVLLKNLKKDQKCILIISEAYKVINFWSYICICMWLHENTPPQFSNKASDDKLKFSTLPSVLPMYTFCRNPKPSKHQLSEGGGGEGEAWGVRVEWSGMVSDKGNVLRTFVVAWEHCNLFPLFVSVNCVVLPK